MRPGRARLRRHGLRLPVQGALAWAALAALLVAMGVWLFHETRGTTFWFDEWSWVINRRGGGLSTFLTPHNEHLSLVPVALYKLLFATAGLADYGPYRALVIAAHLGCVLLLYVYARRRVGSLAALLVATLLLFLGPAWQDVIWPFGLTYFLTLLAGLGAFLMLDRGERLGDGVACVLLAVSLASSGIGLAITLGAAVEVLARRRPWRSAWIVGAPLALYALWWIGYQNASFVRHDVVLAPGFVAGMAASALSALLGLGGTLRPEVPGDTGTFLTWGAPLLVAALAALGWRLAQLRRLRVRVASLLAALLVFCVLTAVSRAFISTPYTSRYLYVSGLFILLLAVELAQGVRIAPLVAALLAIVTAAVAVSNVGAYRDGARYLRDVGRISRADLGALELARPIVSADYVASQLPGYPFVLVKAGAYFAAAKALGSPAANAGQIAAYPEDAKEAADIELTRIHGISLRPAGTGSPRGQRPAIESLSGGSVISGGACVTFRPAAYVAPGVTPELSLTLPPSGLELTADGGPGTVALRRFAANFRPLGQLAAGAPVTLRVGPDRARAPWHVRLVPNAAATVCGLA